MRVLGLRTKALRTEALHANRERDAMHSLAHTDPLTGLPNRRGLNMALASALAHCGPDKLLAVYVMDLDGFKPVNDQHGHDVGDELLVAATRRLQTHVRQSDVVARLGGDEFVVMTGQLGTAHQAHELGLKLLDAFRAPFSLGATPSPPPTATMPWACSSWPMQRCTAASKAASSVCGAIPATWRCRQPEREPQAHPVPFRTFQTAELPLNTGLRFSIKDCSPWPIAKAPPALLKTPASRIFSPWQHGKPRRTRPPRP
jgi:GGDEF domain-containing protein